MNKIFKLPYNGIIFLSLILSFTFLFNFGLVLLLYLSSLLDEFLPVVVIILEVFIINPLYIYVIIVFFLLVLFHNTLDNDFKKIFYYLKYDAKSLLIVILLLFIISPTSIIIYNMVIECVYYVIYSSHQFSEDFSGIPTMLLLLYSLASSLATPFIIFFTGWMIYDKVVKKVFKNRDIFLKLQEKNKDIREKVLYELRKQNETNNKPVE